MTDYIRVVGGSPQPYSWAQFLEDFPNVSLSRNKATREEQLKAYDIHRVFYDQRPAYDPETQKLVKSAPQEVNGEWRVSFTVENRTQAEIDQRVDNEVSTLTDRTNIDTALAMLVADIWQALNTGNVPGQDPNMTQAEARAAVKARLEAHLRTLKGI